MNDSVYRISLETQSLQVGKILYSKRNDTARRLEISLTDGGLPYRIQEGCLAVLTATKPSGLKFYDECQIVGNKIVYEVGNSGLTDTAGEMMCEVFVYAGKDRLTSAAFGMIVENPVYTDGDEIEEPKRITRVLMSPHSAKVGQYLRIVAVSDSGMVLKLAAVDGGDGGGAPGASAYESALRYGFEGTEEEWVDSLNGKPGKTPEKGVDYYTLEDQKDLISKIDTQVNMPVSDISITESADGTLAMVNTLDNGTETIILTPDGEGNPSRLSYNGKEIPIRWAVSG